MKSSSCLTDQNMGNEASHMQTKHFLMRDVRGRGGFEAWQRFLWCHDRATRGGRCCCCCLPLLSAHTQFQIIKPVDQGLYFYNFFFYLFLLAKIENTVKRIFRWVFEKLS